MPDQHGPTEDELTRVRQWPYVDLLGLFEFLRSVWWMPEWGWHQGEAGDGSKGDRSGTRYDLSTGGWSGNEELIAALQDNRMAWMMTWHESRRGGHYRFVVAPALRAEPVSSEEQASGEEEE